MSAPVTLAELPPALRAIIDARFSDFGERCNAANAARAAGHTLREICAATTAIPWPGAGATPEGWYQAALDAYGKVTAAARAQLEATRVSA